MGLVQGQVAFKDLRIGDYSALREFQRDQEFFLNSFIPPQSFSLSSLRNNNNFILIGRKGTGKSSCCLALSVEQEREGYGSTFFNFSDDLSRSDLRDSVRTQSLKIDGKGIAKLYDSIVEFYDFRDLWKRRVLYSIARYIQETDNKNASSEFVRFVTSVSLAESSISEGVGKELLIPVSDIAKSILQRIQRSAAAEKMPLRDYVLAALHLLRECHSDLKYFFFFDELNISHTKSGSDEYETLIALVRDIVRAAADLNDFFVAAKMDIHVVCALRPEVRYQIIRRDNEISKTIDSNFVNLSWPSQSRSSNPLIQLLKNKLLYSHIEINDPDDYLPDSVFAVSEKREVPFAIYFLNITWYRPRDIIRFLKCYQVTNGDKHILFAPNDDQFGFLKEYSRVSRQDVIAELEVKYSRPIINEVLRRIKTPVFHDKDDMLNYLDVLSNRLDLEELINDFFDAGERLKKPAAFGVI